MMQRLGSLGYIGGTPSGPPTQFVLSLINLQSTILGANVKSTVSGVTLLWAGGREWLPTVKKAPKYAQSMFKWVKFERANNDNDNAKLLNYYSNVYAIARYDYMIYIYIFIYILYIYIFIYIFISRSIFKWVAKTLTGMVKTIYVKE